MKKIFTLIAAAAMVLGANAQTKIDLAGLTHADFSYTAGQYEAVTWTDESDPSKTAPAFSYEIGGSTVAELTLTGKNLSFSYKNSGKKPNFFILNSEYFTIGGKGVDLKIAGVKKDQTVTLNVAKKENPEEGKTQIPGFSASNAAWESGEITAEAQKEVFVDIVYSANADGTVTIKNADNGYLIKSITIADAAPETGTKEVVIFDAATQDEKTALAYERTSVEGNVKAALAQLNKFDSSKGPSLKDASTLTVTVPSGKVITKLEITIGGASSAKGSYWMNGETTIEASKSYVFKEEVQTYKIKDNKQSLTWTVKANSSSTNFYMTQVAVTYDAPTGIETVKSAKAIQNGATYNVAGQQVSAAYKGLVIKDGKKFVNK